MSRIGSGSSLASAAPTQDAAATAGSGGSQGSGAPATPALDPMLSAASVGLYSSKPLMMFKGCPRPLGATILLKVRVTNP